ncbi:Leptomycin B resistance protein pmd1 [Venturia nashicola]|uniref:Leptomycin B resistance protein pmd1 n=1 Tax=Venturia nashicola TaxID=86259 RepID=A0A4Z1P5M3_9PEZI|nr:Leptomycin B resistance protein pmd1 [Venturia nashicola]
MATEPLAGDPAATLKKVVASLLNSKDFSDLTLTCKDKVFKAHKAVICPQSRFFYNACKKNTFKVGRKRPHEESETGNIDLSHDDVAAVEAMYRYFYECDYGDLAKENSNAMLLHVRVYCLAHKYDIEALKCRAVEQFQDKAKTESIDAQSFAPIVKEIYDTTESKDKLLRQAAVNIAVENRFAIFKSGGGEFADMMDEIGVFGKDVFLEMSVPVLVAYKCPVTGFQFRIKDSAGPLSHRNNPACPPCAIQHLVKQGPGQVASLTWSLIAPAEMFEIWRLTTSIIGVEHGRCQSYGRVLLVILESKSAEFNTSSPYKDLLVLSPFTNNYHTFKLSGFSNKMATDNQGATLKKGVASLLDSNDFSDMTITVKDNKVFKVHKNIISSQSKFFYNACTKDFKEKKEANIDLSEQDPDAVEALLEYLYKSDYTRLTKDNVNALVLHVHVYQLADMYDIAELKEVAAGLFKEAAEKDWELPAFPLAVQEIYINPEDGAKTLRKLVVNQANENLEALLKDDDGEFAQVMTTFGEFGKDLCRASFQGPTSNRNLGHFQCETSCGWSWRIDQRKASRFSCPTDNYVMIRKDVMGGLTFNDYKCQSSTLNTSHKSCLRLCFSIQQQHQLHLWSLITEDDMSELTSMEGIADLLDSGEYSDMSITCKQKVFKVHKAIVCTRSSFFRNAMKNGTFTESESGNIDVSDDDPLAVEAVLRFVYQGSYSSLAENNKDAMILHTQVYNLAEMYAIKNLKTVAAAEFEKLAKKDFKLPTLPLAIKEIYENCPADDKTLRDIATRIVLSNYDSLLKPTKGDFENTKLMELGDFGRDLLHAKLTRSDLGDSGKVNELVHFHYNARTSAPHAQIPMQRL